MFKDGIGLTAILSGILVLLIDGRDFKAKGLAKEYKLSKVISYSYIIIGISISILKSFV